MKAESRPFRMPDDVADLHQLIADCWQAYGPEITFHVGDLHWRLRPQPDQEPERDIRLWFAQERLLGFAWFDSSDSGDFQCHPEADHDILEPAMLAWLEDRARADDAEGLTVGAFLSNAGRVERLRSRGYEQGSSYMCHMTRSLTEPIATPSLPAGYTISNTATTDLDSFANTLALAFDSDPKTAAAYRTMRASRFYRHDLDWVIKSDRDEVVAFCIAWLDEQNNVGLLEPVGCHPDCQRRGLASAVVMAALESLRSTGADTAIVYPSDDDEAAQAFYQKCGFHAVANDYDWQLEL